MAKMVSIFSCGYLPPEYFPCWIVCADLWPNFQRPFFFSWVLSAFIYPRYSGYQIFVRFVVVKNSEEVRISPTNELTSEPATVCLLEPGRPEPRDKGLWLTVQCLWSSCSRQFPGPPDHTGVVRGAQVELCTRRSRVFYNPQHGHLPLVPEKDTSLLLSGIKKMQGTLSNKYIPPFFVVFHRA